MRGSLTGVVTATLALTAGVVAYGGGRTSSPSSYQAPAGAATGGGTAAASPVASWPVYHGNRTRTGYAPGFPAPRGRLRQAWAARLDGAVYAEPLEVGGLAIAATENDSIYGLRLGTGRIAWRRHLGTPVPLGALPCGNINQLGITGTPAYDATTGSLFAVAEVSGPRHVLFALDPRSGAVRWSRQIEVPGTDRAAQQQRAALAVGSGYVYVGFGGLYGDCGSYRGAVIGVPTSGLGRTISYVVPVHREGGIWATGGPLLDQRGNVYVSVGNGSSTTTYDGSDSVVRLSPRLRPTQRFAPRSWAADNARDLDLGSLSPVLVPGGWVFIAGKRGTGYVLRQGMLGGIGGEVASGPACAAYGGAAQIGATLYLPCRDTGLTAVRVTARGSFRVLWRAKSGANGPPVVGRGAVWSLDLGRGVLLALNPASGAVRRSVAVGSIPPFASPTLAGRLVLVGTRGGVIAVRDPR